MATIDPNPTVAGLTRWFGAGERPARAGVYERRAPAGPYACWDGARWHADAANPVAAVRQSNASKYSATPWRGLAAPSDVPCATCRGHTVIDRGVDVEAGVDLIEECPDC